MRSIWGPYSGIYTWPFSAFAMVAEKLSFESISFSRRCKRASFESTNGIKAGDGDEIITSRLDIAKNLLKHVKMLLLMRYLQHEHTVHTTVLTTVHQNFSKCSNGTVFK